MTAPVLMLGGTASSVGKSVLVAGLCRVFAQDGVRVAPFKAQNMSNNADVTPDGLEIGRAQAEQAAAAGLVPAVEMNPVLLKPQGDRTSQVVLDGRPAGLLRARDFIERKRDLWPHVERALESLRSRYELVVVEGAGSAAEPNLRAGDIVNMRVARHASAVTLLVGDIDRGGVFAHLLGTLELMPQEDRALIRGFVINRFRGDPSLLAPAIDELERRTGVPVLGVVPWIDDLRVAQEDAVALERPDPPGSAQAGTHEVDIAVVHLPRIANFDDFDPLAQERGVRLRYVSRPEQLGVPDLLIIPGTKATIADLEAMRRSGMAEAILARHREGSAILGVCGGYQMLGTHIEDPDGVEAAAGSAVPGLGLLPVSTRFEGDKRTQRVSGHALASAGPWADTQGAAVEGYEIHMGRTRPSPGTSVAPLLHLDGHEDGATSADGLVAGTYLHGLFHNDALRTALLRGLGRTGSGSGPFDREAEFDRLAHHLRAHLDLDRVRGWLGLPVGATVG
ncbi:MAG: cobyric acid synthase [Dehalococcoidia bacterium]|nr:cobyric acid synthase [Dehalococcoidia bacterium]